MMVSNSLFVGTNSPLTITANTISNNSSMSISIGGGNPIAITSATSLRLNDGIEFRAGSSDDWQLGWQTAPTNDAPIMAIDTAQGGLLVVDQSDIALAFTFNQIDADPSITLLPTDVALGETRGLKFMAGSTSSTIDGRGTFMDFRDASSTYRYANTNPGYNTTTIMVTSTGGGGTAFTGETPNGQCYKMYVNNSLAVTVEACGSEYSKTTTTFP